jgi:hypothetical protein
MFLSFSIECDSLSEFLNYWADRYSDKDKDREKYEPFIRKPLTEHGLNHLFEWKNGSKLSVGKIGSISRNYKLTFPKEQLEKRYLDPKGDGGAVWNIFDMHCIDPDKWPIYDQHTHRAMSFMKCNEIVEISANKAEIFKSYREEFIPFFQSLKADGRLSDRALFTFGQFLKLASKFK